MTIQANVAACFSTWPTVATIQPPQVEVQMDGRVEPRVRLDWVESRMGAAPRAGFSAGFGRQSAGGEDVRLEDLAAEIRPGQTVSARLLRGGVLPGAARGDLVVFEGRIGRIEMGLDPEGEHLGFEAEDATAELLRRRAGGRRVRTASGSTDHFDGLRLVFNPDGGPNADADPYEPGGGDPYTVFAPDPPADAIAWTLDEALAYLLAEHGDASGVTVPSPAEVRSAVEPLVIRDVSLEGRTLGEAVEALLELAGGRLLVNIEPGPDGVGRRLDLWRPDRAAAGWLAHQPPGATYAAGATTLAGLTVRMHFDSAPRQYVARGDRRFYESTFDLVAGWDDALAGYDPDDFSPSANPAFDTVRDVFRKWVLNETGRYSGSPYQRGPAPDLSAVFGGAAYVRRGRRLLPCLSRDALGRSRGVYVEMSLDGGASWERMNLGARILERECGLYLTDDPLPPRYLAAAMCGLVRIRVTATLESDSLLVASCGEEEPAAPGRTRYLTVPAGYRFRRVAATSRFYGQGGADEADDTARLEELVRAVREADGRSPAPTRILAPYLALGHRVGERVLGIRGRRLDLARQHEGYGVAPVVRRIRMTFAPTPQTELELE